MGTATDPAYLRVLEDLRAQIQDGVLGPGARVPSRNGIIARYGVGETAAKHALQVLATEGLIEARAGSGSYVRTVPPVSHLEHDRPHFPGSPFGFPEARQPGTGPAGNGSGGSPLVSLAHRSEQVPAPRRLARRLGLADGDPVTKTTYLLAADGSPVQFAISCEPAALAAGTPVSFPEEGPLAGRGVIERMRSIGVQVDQIVEDISVRPASSEESAALAIPAGARVIVVARDHHAGARAVEAGEIIIAADRFHLRYRIPVGPP